MASLERTSSHFAGGWTVFTERRYRLAEFSSAASFLAYEALG
jgi:hypothetical protein